jgi:hydroxyacylglutathione hydrolase
MLEDDFTYVIRKALKGAALAPNEAAARAGLSENSVLSFLRGNFTTEVALRLAPALGLNASALAHHPSYLPKPLALPFIHRLDMPFEQERVNAWLVWTHDAVVLFDTGYQPSSCSVALDAIGVPPLQRIFITHGHVDHVGGIPSFLARGNDILGSSIDRARLMKPGDAVQCGSLTVRACDLSGHADPALGFHIDGLPSPVLVTGDALFAGSIGGCATPASYQHALLRLRENLAGLSPATILLPGHGPATTLGEERASNPFL